MTQIILRLSAYASIGDRESISIIDTICFKSTRSCKWDHFYKFEV